MNKMQHVKESFLYRFKTGKWLGSIARYAILILLAYQLLYPVLYMVSASVKAPIDSYDPGVIWIPKHFSATGFTDAFKTMKYLDALVRSLGIGLCAVGRGFLRIGGIWVCEIQISAEECILCLRDSDSDCAHPDDYSAVLYEYEIF